MDLGLQCLLASPRVTAVPQDTGPVCVEKAAGPALPLRYLDLDPQPISHVLMGKKVCVVAGCVVVSLGYSASVRAHWQYHSLKPVLLTT